MFSSHRGVAVSWAHHTAATATTATAITAALRSKVAVQAVTQVSKSGAKLLERRALCRSLEGDGGEGRLIIDEDEDEDDEEEEELVVCNMKVSLQTQKPYFSNCYTCPNLVPAFLH